MINQGTRSGSVRASLVRRTLQSYDSQGQLNLVLDVKQQYCSDDAPNLVDALRNLLYKTGTRASVCVSREMVTEEEPRGLMNERSDLTESSPKHTKGKAKVMSRDSEDSDRSGSPAPQDLDRRARPAATDDRRARSSTPDRGPPATYKPSGAPGGGRGSK